VAIGARVDGPQHPTGWRRHSAAGTAGAHRSSVLHGYGALFLVVSIPTEPVECEELTKGVFYRWGRGGFEARRVAAWFKLQPSTMVGEHSKGRLMTRLGQMGAAWNVEHQRQVDGA
jgi:hypothetical protein